MKSVVAIVASEEYPRNGEGSLIETQNGDLTIFCTRFHRGTDDNSEASIWRVVSRDGGCHWSDPEEVLPNQGAINTMSVSLATLDAGTLLCVMVKDSPHKSHLEFYRSTDSDLKNWNKVSSFEPQGPEQYIGVHNDRLIRTGNGELILPVNLCENPGMTSKQSSTSFDYVSPRVTTLLRSTDVGLSWHMDASRVNLPGRGAMEPCVCEISDGKLLITMRTQLGSIYVVVVEGDSYSNPFSLGISSPEAPHTMKKIPDSFRYHLIHCPNYVSGVHHFGPRYPLVIRQNVENWQLWSSPKEIASGEDGRYEYANPSLCYISNTIATTYYRRHLQGERYNWKDLIFSRIDADEIFK